METSVEGEPAHRQTVFRRRLGLFVARNPGGHQPHFGQVKATAESLSRGEMPDVRRIERAAENTNLHLFAGSVAPASLSQSMYLRFDSGCQ